MHLLEYWPSREYIDQCIRTEAEELAEHNLLAVHEPMRLRRKGLSETESCSDEDLLKDFLQVERPIPIIGRSGVGKSHLLRWLHAKLKVHPEATEWHIVRIPKNASLRQVLELLLTGLEGENFAQARQRVKSVGEQLDTREVAQLLLTFMGQQLQRLYQKALLTREQYQQSGTKPQQEEFKRLRIIDLHCGENGLPALMTDPHFQTYLLKQEHCIFQFARRLTSGASDDEINDNDYQIHASDLNFNYNLGDLSRPAATYIRQAQLNTSEEKRQEATTVLNEVLGEATRTAFRQLFQFGGSNFQELFKQIRQDLFKKKKTLVILVEDMAAISAIEDVLIDSLLEEGIYDGVETMCSLRSAIAVTDGYDGYTRRQDTLRTRAKAEWRIEELQEDETEQVMQQRVVDFCSRYINAARHGSQALQQYWCDGEESKWPPIWENEEVDRQHLDAFGRAATGISLYPLSPLAISALVNKHCRDDQGQLRFNPRQVINQILLNTLRECRIDAECGKFPPIALAGVSAPVALRTDLAMLGLASKGRCESLAAIWGYGAGNLIELKEKLSADIALNFGLNDLAKHLQSGVVHVSPSPETKTERTKREPQGQPKPPIVDPGEQKLKALLTEVDLWCQREKNLAQEEAKILRKALAAMYQAYAYGRKEWIGITELPSIKSRDRVNITLPFAASNNIGWVVEFCSESDFMDPIRSILFHDLARTMLRYSHFNPEYKEGKGWNYPQGHEDFLRYQDFAAHWVPGVLRTLRDNEQKKLDASMTAHVAAARILAIFKENDNYRERLNKLLQTQQSLTKTFTSPICDTVSTERQAQLTEWELLQKNWLKLISSNDHGLDGDLALVALKKALKEPLSNRINQAVAKSLRELKYESEIILLFADCESVDDFNCTLKDLDVLVKQLQTTGKYLKNDQVVTSKTLLQKINALIDVGHFDQIKKFRRLNAESEPEQQWQILNELDSEKVRLLADTVFNWQASFDITFPSLQTENSKWGGERVTATKESIDSLLGSLLEIVTNVQGGANGNS